MHTASLRHIIAERFGDSIGSYAGESAIGVRDEVEMCECGCGATVEQCTCGNSPEVDYVEGDTCPVCNMLALDVSNPGSCGCNSMGEGKVNMNTGHAITTASAEKKSAPKVASNTKKAVNNLARTPGDKITGLEMGNLMASKRNTKDSKQFAKKPDAMKPTDTKINYKGL